MIELLFWVVAANVAYIAWGVWRSLPEVREHNFEGVRKVASRAAEVGWVPVRVSWHGLLRCSPHMELAHDDYPEGFTVKGGRGL